MNNLRIPIMAYDAVVKARSKEPEYSLIPCSIRMTFINPKGRMIYTDYNLEGDPLNNESIATLLKRAHRQHSVPVDIEYISDEIKDEMS